MKKTFWHLALGLSLLLSSAAAVSADTTGPRPAKQQRQHQGMHHKMQHPNMHRGPFMGLMRDLELSAEQKAQFKALYSESRSKPTSHKAFRAKVQAAFVSEQFDAAALKQALQQEMTGAPAQKMAAHLLQAWQILTPEQRSQLEARLQQMEARRAKKAERFAAQRQKKQASDQPGRLPRHLKTLNLTEAQQSQLQALWDKNRSVRTQNGQDLKKHKKQILALLKSDQATPEKLAELMPAAQMQQGALQMIDRMAALHQILTPAQRQQMVEQMQQKQKFQPHRRQGA